MANHRMFSNRIANSAKFLQMPAEAQLLYFHMILRADDDGVVEAYPLLKILGTPSDVFKVLIAKKFIVQLNEDQVVVITKWLEHNKIRADRKVNSIYKNLLEEKNIETLAPKQRSDVKDNSKRLEVDSPLTDNGRHKLSKVKLSEVKLSKSKLELTPSQFAKSFFENFNIQEEVIKNLTKKHNANPAELRKEIDNFILYWTEPNKSGTKVRWQLQPTFDITRRLITWFKRSNEFNNNKGIQSL